MSDYVIVNGPKGDRNKDVSDKMLTLADQKPPYVRQLEKNLGDKSNKAGSGRKVPDLIVGLENLGKKDSSDDKIDIFDLGGEDVIKTSKDPVAALMQLGDDVRRVVEGDPKLQTALRKNPKGAEQLCQALETDKTALKFFIENTAFRNRIVRNLDDSSCAYPLPVGKFKIPIKKKVVGILKNAVCTALENAPGFTYASMVETLIGDFKRAKSRSFKVNGVEQQFDLPPEKDENGTGRKKFEKELQEFFTKIDVRDEAEQVKILALMHQSLPISIVKYSNLFGAISFPQGTTGAGVNTVSINFNTSGGKLTCDYDLELGIYKVGLGEDLPISYDKNTSKTNMGFSFDLNRSGEGGALGVETVRATTPEMTFDLKLDDKEIETYYRNDGGEGEKLEIEELAKLSKAKSYEDGKKEIMAKKAKAVPQKKPVGGFSGGCFDSEGEGVLKQLARMAYGSGYFEKTWGGEGYVGLVRMPSGRGRIIKFDTKLRERYAWHSPEEMSDQIDCSNNLRLLIFRIVSNSKLTREQKNEIMNDLGIRRGDGGKWVIGGDALFKRKSAAALIWKIGRMIGRPGAIWGAATEGVDMKAYRSVGSSRFEDTCAHACLNSKLANPGILQRCDLSVKEIGDAVKGLADTYGLADEEVDDLTRITVAYLCAQEEEGRLPVKDEILRLIRTGNFNGTVLGLAYLGKIDPNSDPKPFALADGEVDFGEAYDLMGSLYADDAEAAAYLLGKFRKCEILNGQQPGDVVETPGICVLKALVENKDALLAFREKNGGLTFDDLCKLQVGMSFSRERTQSGKRMALFQQVLRMAVADFDRRHPGFNLARTLKDWPETQAYFKNIASAVKAYGFSLDDAMLRKEKKGNLLDPADLRGLPKFRCCNTKSSLFRDGTKDGLVRKVGEDISRYGNAKGFFDVRIGNVPTRIRIGKDDPEGHRKAELLYDAFCRMLGLGKDVDLSKQKQLKAMMLASSNGGNRVFGALNCLLRQIETLPAEKSFSLAPNGHVLYTVAAVLEGKRIVAGFGIAPDGSSRFLGFNRSVESFGTPLDITGGSLDRISEVSEFPDSELDSAALVRCLGIGEEQAGNLEIGSVVPFANGEYMLRTYVDKVDRTRSYTVMVDRKGAAKKTDAELINLLTGPAFNLDEKVVVSFLGILKPGEEELAKRFLKAFERGGEGAPPYVNAEDSIHGADLGQGALNLFASALPSLRERQDVGNPDALVPILREVLGLPPEANSNYSALGSECALFMDIREKLFSDMASLYDVPTDVRTVLLPLSPQDVVEAGEHREKDGFSNRMKPYRMICESFCAGGGMSYFDRLRFFEGKSKLALANFPLGTFQERGVSDPEANIRMMKGNVARGKGLKYHLGDELIYEIGGMKSSKIANKKIEDAGYTPAQISHLVAYANEGGADLLRRIGLLPYCGNADIKIFPKKPGSKDMRVRARLPISFPTGWAESEGTFHFMGEQTNMYVDHEFVIRPDGTVEVKGLQAGLDANRPKSTPFECEEFSYRKKARNTVANGDILQVSGFDETLDSPGVTAQQKGNVRKMDRANLARCLGIGVEDTADLVVDTVEPLGENGLLKCVLRSPDGKTWKVLCDREGVVFSYEDYKKAMEVLCCESIPDEKFQKVLLAQAFIPIDFIDHREMANITRWLGLLDEGLKAVDGDTILVTGTFLAMLTPVLPKVRAKQGEGKPITMRTLAEALHLEITKYPVTAQSFATAVSDRILKDANHSHPDQPEDKGGGKHGQRLRTAINTGFKYCEALIAHRYKLGFSKDGYRAYREFKLPEEYRGITAEGLKEKGHDVNWKTFVLGSQWRVDGQTMKLSDNPSFDGIVNRLGECGFNAQQTAALLMMPHAWLVDLGTCFNAKSFISQAADVHIVRDGDRMKAVYFLEWNPQDGESVPAHAKFLRYEAMIDANGNAACTDMRLVSEEQKAHELANPGQPLPPVPHFTPEQAETIVYSEGFENPRFAQDNKTILCDVTIPGQAKRQVSVLEDGSVVES